MTTVPALISEMTRAEAILFQLTKNIQREDLNDVDAARGIRLLVEECGLRTNQEIADRRQRDGRPLSRAASGR